MFANALHLPPCKSFLFATLMASMLPFIVGRHMNLSQSIAQAKSVWNEKRAEEVISTYLKHRRRGLSHREIIAKIFKVRLPQSKMDHCYPFVCTQLFPAAADAVVRRGRLQRDGKPVRDLKDGAVIYMRPKQVSRFALLILPNITANFILVTHESDTEMPNFDLGVDAILSSPLLLKWFAVNPSPDFWRHPKVACLPYGLGLPGNGLDDLERALAKPIPERYSPRQDNQTRPIYLYMNFKVRRESRYNRKAYARHFRKFGTFRNRTSAEQYYADLARSKFVLSPRGYGIDCHRTYESILFGAIPVVDHISPILTREVFRQAPVLVLRGDWRIKMPNLRRLWMLNHDGGKGKSVVMAQYWLDQIEAVRKYALLNS